LLAKEPPMSPRVETVSLSAIEPIEQVDLSERVYSFLREKIFARQFPPGAKLDLDHLAEGLRVSRTPINNALIRLSEEGLLRVEPRRGTFINELTTRDVAEWYDVRKALELLAAEKGICRVTDDGVELIGQLLRQMEAVRGDIEDHYLDHVKLDRQFHLTLVDFAEHRKLQEMYRSLHSDVVNARLYYYGRGHLRDRNEVDAEHVAIFRAYAARDLVAAREAIAAANDNAQRAATRRIQELGGIV
jgi:DNA-binding GntR family transcriptional regulator